MLSTIVSAALRRPRLVIAVWFAVAVGLGGAGTLVASKVTATDQAQFLPSHYESARAVAFGRRAFGQVEGASAVTVLIKRADRRRMGGADARRIGAVAAGLARWRPDWPKVRRPVDAPPFGPDAAERATRVVSAAQGPIDPHGFALARLTFKGTAVDPWVRAAFRQLRQETRARFARAGYHVGFTGGAASATDAIASSRKSQQLGQQLLFAAAVLLSALFFRGVLAAIVPLLTVGIVGGAATGLIELAAAALHLHVAQSTPALIGVVLVGVGIDYFLFLLFRFREALRNGREPREAARAAAERTSPVIASAALAVVAAFATLGLAQYGELRALGPAIALSVALMLVAGITLMPALLAVTGRRMFWPSTSWRRPAKPGFATRIAGTIAAHPGRVVVATVALLGALSVGALHAHSSYDTSPTAPGTESARVADDLARALPRGATDPQIVYVRSPRRLSTADLEPLVRRLAAVRGVADVGRPAFGQGGHAVAIAVVLGESSSSGRAMAIARGPLRRVAHAATPPDTEALVGGTAAIMADISDSMGHDLRLIFPVAAGLILLILVVLLRSFAAPLYLLAAAGLEFTATLGASAWLFQDAIGEPGLIFTIPLVLFLFVVALGTDYNVLASARLREEMRAGRPVHEAVTAAVGHTAPAIAAAASVLAASFATLLVEHDRATKETGFAMALGVLLAGFVVSTLLVPSITVLVGRRAWWPGDRPRRRGARVASWTPRPAPANSRSSFASTPRSDVSQPSSRSSRQRPRYSQR
jgi:putative drug exporter of the RND superfamily